MKPCTPLLANLPALLRGPMDPTTGTERILIPFDGSPTSERALEHAIAKSASGRLHIVVVNVQPPVMAGDVTAFTPAAAVEQRRRNVGMALLKPATSALQARRIAHTAHVAFGDPAREIARSAERYGCTKILMGTRAMGVLRSLVSRSVARRVVELAAVPVTLVKADAAAREETLAMPAVPA